MELDRKGDAHLHYLQALAALNRLAEMNDPTMPSKAEAVGRLTLAHISAAREQTAVLERIAAQLERRDVVEIVEAESPGQVDRFLERGWVYLGSGPIGTVTEDRQLTLMHVVGRPRNLKDGGTA